jgi:hypothetical protein
MGMCCNTRVAPLPSPEHFVICDWVSLDRTKSNTPLRSPSSELGLKTFTRKDKFGGDSRFRNCKTWLGGHLFCDPEL